MFPVHYPLNPALPVLCSEIRRVEVTGVGDGFRGTVSLEQSVFFVVVCVLAKLNVTVQCEQRDEVSFNFKNHCRVCNHTSKQPLPDLKLLTVHTV